MPWEASGLVPDGEWLFDTYQTYWSLGDTVNVSIGQGYFLLPPPSSWRSTRRPSPITASSTGRS